MNDEDSETYADGELVETALLGPGSPPVPARILGKVRLGPSSTNLFWIVAPDKTWLAEHCPGLLNYTAYLVNHYGVRKIGEEK